LSELCDCLVLVLDNLLVGLLGLLVPALLVNDVLTQPFEFLLSDSDPFVDQVTLLVGVQGVFPVLLLKFGQLNFVHFRIRRFGFDVLYQISAGE